MNGSSWSSFRAARNIEDVLDEREDVPPCALAMGCLCAWHAVGAPGECNADEEKAREWLALDRLRTCYDDDEGRRR